MRKIILVAALIIIAPRFSYAQVRLNVKFDISHSSVSDSGMAFTWDGKEIEIEKEFKKNRLFLSGLAVGVRKEGRVLIEGNYFYARFYRKYPLGKLGKWELNPSVSIIYGDPGLQFENTSFNAGGYTHVNQVRNAGIPYYDVRKAAVLYPEVSVALRKKLKRFSVESVAGARVMRYGILKSDYMSGQYKEKIILSPSLGLRLGFRF